MAETSSIEWTDATVNFWWGCTRVGPGCDHCYAEALNKVRGNKQWGLGAPRRLIKGAAATLARLDRQSAARKRGRRERVFMQSMSDLFDKEVSSGWSMRAFDAAKAAHHCDIIFLTKRITNVQKLMPYTWWRDWPQHIGLMITVVNQEEAERDVPRLLELKARHGIPWVGLSCEPLLGPIWLAGLNLMTETPMDCLAGVQRIPDASPQGYTNQPCQKIDWVIAGGESGPKARPAHPDWLRALRDQCAETGTPFLFKQWGEWCYSEPVIGKHIAHALANDGTLYKMTDLAYPDGPRRLEALQADHDKAHLTTMYRVGKKAAGRLLDGVEHNGFPKAFEREPA